MVVLETKPQQVAISLALLMLEPQLIQVQLMLLLEKVMLSCRQMELQPQDQGNNNP